MNIFSRIPSLIHSNDPEDAKAVAEAAEQAKQDRIKFHRESVRNGPVKFKTAANGQIRRAQKRAAKTRSRKIFRRQVREYLANQREGAIIRAKLQDAGVLAFVTPHAKIDPVRAHAAIVWIVRHFAEAEEGATVEVTQQVVVDSIQSALNRWQTIVGMPVTPLSPSYVLPVAVA